MVSVGPLECMPNKLAEAQFHHVAEREGLLSLTLSLNGDPLDEAALDGFAFEVHRRFRKRNVVGEEAMPCPASLSFERLPGGLAVAGAGRAGPPPAAAGAR